MQQGPTQAIGNDKNIPTPDVATGPAPKPLPNRTTAPDTPMTTPTATKPTIDTTFLAQYAQTYRFYLGRPSSFAHLPDGTLLFQRSGPRSFVRDIYALKTDGTESVFLTAKKVLDGADETLSAAEKARRERTRTAARGITSFNVSDDGKTVIVPLSGKLYLVDVATQKVTERGTMPGYPLDPQLSPDGATLACVRNGHLHLIDVASGTERRLTPEAVANAKDGQAKPGALAITWGDAEFVAQEEMGRMHGYWWAPDSSGLLVQHTDATAVETLHIVDPMRPEGVPASFRYPRAGTPNAIVKLAYFKRDGGAPRWITWDHKRWEYLANVVWSKANAAAPTIVVQDRAQKEVAVLAADIGTGETKPLHVEKDEAWVNLDLTVPRWLDKDQGGGFLWISEAEGWPQLQHRDATGGLVRTLTPARMSVGGVEQVEQRGDDTIVWLTLSTDAAPASTHVAEVDLKTAKLVIKTDDNGRFGVHVAKTGAHVVTAHKADGDLAWTSVSAKGAGQPVSSKAEAPPFKANVEWTTIAPTKPGGDDLLHAAIIRPRSFDEKQKYPVLVHVYGGPHAQVVTHARGGYLLDQWFADLGYIVVRIDGRGTPARGRQWERTISDDFISAPLNDQVRGLQALGAATPAMDMSRVGIFGWSFGGYFSAMAVMQRPDVFHAGLAGAPVCSWEDYDTHYTERYIGVPKLGESNPAYKRSDVLTYADKLERPLLIMHGTADDNVYFTHAVKLSDALFRAGKDHEFLPLSGFTHMVPDPNVTTRLYTRFATFFNTNVMARKP